jgi:hypothetical protein
MQKLGCIYAKPEKLVEGENKYYNYNIGYERFVAMELMFNSTLQTAFNVYSPVRSYSDCYF